MRRPKLAEVWVFFTKIHTKLHLSRYLTDLQRRPLPSTNYNLPPEIFVFREYLLLLQPFRNVLGDQQKVHYAKDENQFQREEEIRCDWIGENQA
jgi:hypothetical protein